jgi:iron-sulfur cluster assembly protein
MSAEINITETEKAIDLTPSAIQEVSRLIGMENKPDLFLRVGVMAGGCSGMSYAMGFDTQISEYDREYDFGPFKVIVDEESLQYLSGSTLDFKGGLMGGGFTFLNPKATRSCGCGSSFRC